MLEVVLVLAHQAQDGAQNGDVVLFTVCTDEVGFANLALLQDAQHSRGVVGCVNPVTNVQALAVQLRGQTREDVSDLAGNELLDVLVGAVVVGAVRDGCFNTEGADPCAHEQVGACLSGGVRGRGVVGSGFGELCRIVQLEVAEDLVGGDVVVASAVLTDCFQEAESTDEVSVDERFGVGQGVVVVRFRSVVNDSVCLADQFVSQLAVGDVAYDELEAGFRKTLQRRSICGVGHLIQHSNSVISVIDEVVNKVRTNKTGTAGNKNVSHTVYFTCLNSDFYASTKR